MAGDGTGDQNAARTAAGGALSLALALAPWPAFAAAPQADQSEATSETDLEASRRLYLEGKAFFDTSQYERAVEIWTRAYGKVPDDAPEVRNRIVYNIATAQEQAYAIDHDVVHLRQANQLLRTYVDNLDHDDADNAQDIARAQARIAEIEARIEQAVNDPELEPKPETDQPSPADGDETRKLTNNRRLASESRKVDTMIVAGYVTGSVGLVFLAGGIGGISGARAANTAAGRRAGEGVGYGGLALGVAGVATGAVLLGVGFSKRKRLRQGKLAVVPYTTRTTAGLTVTGRF